MNRFRVDLPRPVLIAVVTIVLALGSIALLIPFLGGARDAALEDHQRMTNEIAQARASTALAQADQKYVNDNLAHYEELMAGTRLVPHTRRAAVAELERVALAHGVGAMTYAFKSASQTSPVAVANQSKGGGYTLAVESVEIHVGASQDGPIYRFMSDISRSFPGSAIIQSVGLARPVDLTPALRDARTGNASKMVEGDILLLWRTAQAQAESKAAATGAK